MRGEPGTVGTGALDAEAKDLPELGSPLGELLVSAAIRGDAEVALGAADDVDSDRGVHVLMGVDSDDDFPDRLGPQDAGHGCPFPSRKRRSARGRRPGGRTGL